MKIHRVILFTLIIIIVLTACAPIVPTTKEGDKCVIDLTSCSESQKASAWKGQSSLDGTIISAFYLDKEGLMCKADTVVQSWPVVTEESWWCGVVKVSDISDNNCNFLPTPFDVRIMPSSEEISLSWQGNSTDIGVYNIERATNVNGPYQLYVQTGAGAQPGINSFSFSDERIQPGVEYCYRIQSQHTDGTKGCFTDPVCTQIDTATEPVADMTCESLDTLVLGQQITVTSPPGNSFQPPTMDIGARPFTWGNGTMTRDGFARIENGGLAGGSANEINVNNILLSVTIGLGQTLQKVQLSFGEYGGNLNVSVNDKLVNFSDFSDIAGTTINGVTVNLISGGNGNDIGQIEFTGNMIDQESGLGQFSIGGQELYIDDICYIP